MITGKLTATCVAFVIVLIQITPAHASSVTPGIAHSSGITTRLPGLIDMGESTISGAADQPRGALVKQLPFARPIVKHRCDEQGCQSAVIGYLAPVPLHMSFYAPKQSVGIAEQLRSSAHMAAVSDAVTTLAGLSAGVVEVNPILGSAPSPASILGFTALKMAMINNLADNPARTQQQLTHDLCTVGAVMGAASYNNLAVIAGATGAVPVLIVLAAGNHQLDQCVVKANQQVAMTPVVSDATLAAYVKAYAKPNNPTLFVSVGH